MSTDTHDITNIASRVERHANELGWDAMPALIVIKDAKVHAFIGIMTDGKGYDAMVGAVHKNPQLREIIAAGDGLAFSLEGWSHPKWVTDQISAGAPLESFGRPSTYKDRLEIRTVISMLRDGKGVSVTRTRGERPEEDEVLVTPIEDTTGGVVDTLRQLLAL